MTRIRGLKEVIERDEAVSPIIATILLVAITVILASTLYLALGGFFSHTTTATPSVGLSHTNTTTAPKTAGYTYTITLGSPSSNTIAYSATDWVVTIDGTTYAVGNYVAATSTAAGNWTLGTALSSTTASTSYYITIAIPAGTGTYVSGGTTLTLSIYPTGSTTTAIAPPAGPIQSIAFDYTGSASGQMGTTGL
ncbi:MAG: archaellin/type IV pilin N-terminal domain-containing protein [Thermoplasmataceae archaeon]